METAPHGFRGTDRFELVRVIGRGGMGVVYEARDHLQGSTVALKLLPNASPDRLLRFKREFRAAAELHHENLVRLGELVRAEDQWFFTMELVAGTDLLSYVLGRSVDPSYSHSRLGEVTNLSGSEPPTLETAATGSPLAPAEEERARTALTQLAQALAALHSAGIIHRDVKPSNVLVTREGRVVLLDFGLASLASEETTLFGAGTPIYMAPEQATGPVTPAADWYAFGVLLFELLTGSVPFSGAAHLVVLAKQSGTAPSVLSRNPLAPPGLARLCDALLAPEISDRPPFDAILAQLTDPSAPATASPSIRDPERSLLVGRERELYTLRRAFDEVSGGGRPLALMVRGDSGIGKSTLVQKFGEGLTSERRALVFAGRCHERELMPYKAVDAVFDAIAQWLRRQPNAEVEALLPRRPGVLARVFPVLARVRAIARAEEPALAVDPQELRGWLFAAARELLANIARLQPVIVAIDDLHWADQDSLALLSEVLSGSSAPRLLLLCTVRTSAGARLPERLLPAALAERCLNLGALSAEASTALAQQLLGGDALQGVDARALSAESGGHPLFLRELARQLASKRDRSEGYSLEAMLRARVESMSAPAVRLLRLLAIAGAPLRAEVLKAASELSAESLSEARHELRAHGFLHVLGSEGAESFDVAHDRIRRAVQGALDAAEAHALHAHLAQTLERLGDAAASAVHWREAGESIRAARYYLRAGELASAAFAFGDAVDHYSAALELGDWPDQERRELRIRLADALSNAGRGAKAAEQYRLAAEAAEPAARLELKRRAAGELLRSGYLEQGVSASREVLSQAGIEFARFPLLALLLRRALLRLRGLGHRERAPEQTDVRALERIDLCWSLSSGLVLTDHVQGAYLQTSGLALALRAGDPFRVARALAAEAAFSAGFGARALRRVYRVMERAEAIARRLAEPKLIATVSLMTGVAAHLGGRFAEAKAHLEQATTLFRERCTGVSWELDACRQFWLDATFYLGELAGYPEAVTRALKEAEDRGSLYARAGLRSGLPNAIWLMADQPEQAAAESDAALSQWSGRGFHVQHWYQLVSRTHVELYLGQGWAAHQRIESRWAELERSHLLRLCHARVVARHLRGRAALAAAMERPTAARPALRLVRQLARALERERMPWAEALAALLFAGAEQVEGRPLSMTRVGYLRGLLDRTELKVFRAALDTGQTDENKLGTSALAQLGVRQPLAFARILVPGLAG